MIYTHIYLYVISFAVQTCLTDSQLNAKYMGISERCKWLGVGLGFHVVERVLRKGVIEYRERLELHLIDLLELSCLIHSRLLCWILRWTWCWVQLDWRLSDDPIDEESSDDYKDPEYRKGVKCRKNLSGMFVQPHIVRSSRNYSISSPAQNVSLGLGLGFKVSAFLDSSFCSIRTHLQQPSPIRAEWVVKIHLLHF